MDLQTIRLKLIDHLKEQKALLERSRDQAKAARDDAPSAMESHSDTTRSEKEKLVAALEWDIAAMDGYLKAAQKMDPAGNENVALWSYTEIAGENGVMKLFLVPEGLGGKKIDEIILLSVASPLGMVIVGKKSGDEVVFNGRKWQVG